MLSKGSNFALNIYHAMYTKYGLFVWGFFGTFLGNKSVTAFSL